MLSNVYSILIIVLSLHIYECRDLVSVRFQTSGITTTNSFLDFKQKFRKDLNQISICTHVLLLHVGDPIPIVSYFAQDIDGEIFISFNWKRKSISILCCNMEVRLEIKVQINLYIWHHLCVVLDLSSKFYIFTFDDYVEEGEISVRSENEEVSTERLRVRNGGRLVIGQDLDNMNGGFSKSQTLHGYLSDFRLFDKTLTKSEMISFISCNEIDVNPVIYFNEQMSTLSMMGDTELFLESDAHICDKKRQVLVLFPEKQNFESSRLWCSNLKGDMYVPKTDKENKDTFDTFSVFDEQCVDNWGTFYWLGVKGNLRTNQWSTLEDNLALKWSNFTKGWKTPTEGTECASVGGKNFPYQWFSTPCDTLMCAVCRFDIHPRLRVKGLCRKSLVDRTMFVYRYKNGKPALDGVYYSSVFWDGQEWVLASRRYSYLMGQMVDLRSNYPFGVTQWLVYGDTCDKNTVKLLISPCDENEFTCHDGSCITMEKRCNFIIDCQDTSDELECDVIVLPPGYSKHFPPPKMLEFLPVFFITTNITSINDININTFQITLNLVTKIRWKDSRLMYNNLRDNIYFNKVNDFESIWMPKLLYYDGTRTPVKITSSSQSLYIEKLSLSLPGDDTTINQDKIYSGSENTLVYIQEQELKFSCNFELLMYPIDAQRCAFSYYIRGLDENFGTLYEDNNGIIYEGQRKLKEYELLSETLVQAKEDNVSFHKIFLELKRINNLYILTSFVPSILLVIICYMTFYFNITDFQNRIMVSLTSLLVLATLMCQASNHLPNTTYIKLIDIWFLGLILITFSIIVCLISIEYLRQKHNIRLINVLPKEEFLAASAGSKLSAKSLDYKVLHLNKKFIIIFPFIIFFYVLYFVIAISI